VIKPHPVELSDQIDLSTSDDSRRDGL